MSAHRLIAFGDQPYDGSSEALVVFNHIPKTGGTTAASILSRELQAEHISLECADHFLAFRQREGTLPRMLFLEGKPWGMQSTVPGKRDFMLFTMLRDPVGMFRSSFSYNVNNLFIERDLEHWVEYYRHNTMTNRLGGGCLEEAKRRLEGMYVFGVLDDFDASIAMFARHLGISITSFRRRNVSGSGKIDMSPALERRVRALNAKDYELFAWARDLFAQRVEILCARDGFAPKPLEEIADGKESQHINLLTEDQRIMAEIRDRIAEGDRQKAKELCATLETKTFSILLYLARDSAQCNDVDEACSYYDQAMEILASHSCHEYVHFLLRYERFARAEEVIRHQIDTWEAVITFDMPWDAVPRWERTMDMALLTKILVDAEELERACPLITDLLNGLCACKASFERGSRYHAMLLRIFGYAGLILPELSKLEGGNELSCKLSEALVLLQETNCYKQGAW